MKAVDGHCVGVFAIIAVAFLSSFCDFLTNSAIHYIYMIVRSWHCNIMHYSVEATQTAFEVERAYQYVSK